MSNSAIEVLMRARDTRWEAARLRLGKIFASNKSMTNLRKAAKELEEEEKVFRKYNKEIRNLIEMQDALSPEEKENAKSES